MKFIGDDYVQARIAIFPPILVTGDNHLQSAGRTHGILNRVDHSGGRERQGYDYQYRDDGPGQLYLAASVDLGGLAVIITMFPPEPHDGVGEQSEDDQEDR